MYDDFALIKAQKLRFCQSSLNLHFRQECNFQCTSDTSCIECDYKYWTTLLKFKHDSFIASKSDAPVAQHLIECFGCFKAFGQKIVNNFGRPLHLSAKTKTMNEHRS